MKTTPYRSTMERILKRWKKAGHSTSPRSIKKTLTAPERFFSSATATVH